MTPAGRPSEARDFNKLRRYHTRPIQFKWGPKNLHFGKMHFRNTNIGSRILWLPTKIDNNTRFNFFCFPFFTTVPIFEKNVTFQKIAKDKFFRPKITLLRSKKTRRKKQYRVTLNKIWKKNKTTIQMFATNHVSIETLNRP